MAVAGQVVEPGGINLLRLLFGVPGPGDPGPGAANFLGNLFGGGELFSGFGDTYRKGMSGGLVAPNNPYLDLAVGDSAGRMSDWDDSWRRFFDTDLVGADGNLIQRGPLSQTGMRTGREFGGFGQGGPTNVQDTDLYRQLFGRYDADGARQAGSFDTYYADIGEINPVTGKRGKTGRGEYFDPKVWGERLDAPGSNYSKAFSDNKYSNPTQWSSDVVPLSQWRSDQLNTFSPETAAKGFFGLSEARKQMGYDPLEVARGAIDMGSKYDQESVDALSKSIDEEANRSLALQLPEVRQQAQMLGLTDGAAGERLGGDVARDVIGQAARKKADVLAQYRDSAAQRRNQLLGNYQDIGGRAGADLLSGAGNIFGQQYGAREAAMNQMYGTTADALARGQTSAYDAAMQMARDIYSSKAGAMTAGMQANMARGDRMMGIEADIANSAFGGITDRMRLEDAAQSGALRDYMALVNSRDAYRTNRLNELLGLSGEQRNLDQERLNMEAQYGMLPMNWLMQLVTGTTPAGAPQGGGFNWGSLLGGLAPSAANYVLGMANTGAQPQAPRSSYDGWGPQ
jgi:hypothetical protein